jgi:hypothetical protein
MNDERSEKLALIEYRKQTRKQAKKSRLSVRQKEEKLKKQKEAMSVMLDGFYPTFEEVEFYSGHYLGFRRFLFPHNDPNGEEINLISICNKEFHPMRFDRFETAIVTGFAVLKGYTEYAEVFNYEKDPKVRHFFALNPGRRFEFAARNFKINP